MKADNMLEEDLLDDSLLTGNFPRRGGPHAGRRKDLASTSANTRVPDVSKEQGSQDRLPSRSSNKAGSETNSPVVNKKKASKGWGADDSTSVLGDMSGGASQFNAEQDKSDDDSDGIGLRRKGSLDDMPVIPDLQDQVKEDMLAVVADAPASTSGRIQTIRSLDQDMKQSMGTSLRESGIDVSMLASFIHEPAVVKEEMIPWTWDTLFTEVASQIRNIDEKAAGGIEMPKPSPTASAG